MKYLLTSVFSLFLLYNVYAGNGDEITMDYEKYTMTIGDEEIKLNKEQKESFIEWKKELDEKGYTNDFSVICPHFNEMMDIANDDAAIVVWAKKYPHEMMIVKYNLQLRNQSKSNNKED